MMTKLGPNPVEAMCPTCGVTMITKVSSEYHNSTHLFACFLCIIFFPCAWLPYCVSIDLIKHKCLACNAILGTYSPPSSSDNSTYHSSTHYANTDSVHRDTSHCNGGDGGGDCGGGGGDSGGGGGSCD